MRTVKEFKDAGVVFVVGDKICYETGIYNGMESDLFEVLSNNDWIPDPIKVNGKIACGAWTLSSFAWRELTTKPDNAKFKIELDIANHRWRPSLNQGKEWPDEQRINAIGQNGNDGLHYDNATQQFEALASDKPVKPVFTQTMADTGELPPVGSKVLVVIEDAGFSLDDTDSKFEGKTVTVKALFTNCESEKIVAIENDGGNCACYIVECIKPIPKTITVNGFEVPEPVREEINKGESYYAASSISRRFYEKLRWSGDSTDSNCLSRGIIHSNKYAAISHTKAMLGIDPNADS